jgi:type VI secretion system protein ImpA
MGSPATIDLDRLLAPISDDSPSGEDPRADASPVSDYYQLKDARKAARAKERSLGLEETELPDTRSDWRPVFEQAVELLSTRSKDIEVLAWLIESLVRLEGFAGLRDAFQLTQGFVKRYWDDFFPHEESLVDRIAPFSGLNGQDAEGTLIFPIRNVPITEEHTLGPFATWHYQQAVSLQQIADPEARERRIQAGAATMDQIDKAALESDAAFLKDLYDDLQACRSDFHALTDDLDARCGIDAAPPSSNINNELNTCLEAVEYVARRVIVEEQTEATEADAAPLGETTESGAGALPAGKAMTREQAFQQLLQLADFFRRTEPHSPLSYAIERIVRWGRMPLPELLSEIITEDDARNNLFWLAGISKPGPTAE